MSGYSTQVDEELVLDPTLAESGVGATGATAGEPAAQQSMGEKMGFVHPVAVFFHLFFKIVATIFYVLGNIFIDFTAVFIVTVILLAMDFWTVKNVTGRLLVGLRWWNQIKEDGSNEWIFESLEGQRQIHKTEMMIFWGSTLLFPLLWGAAVFFQFIGLRWNWLLISVVGLSLSVSNAAGFIKCARTARQQVSEMITGYVTQKAVEHITKQINESVNNKLGGVPPASGTSSSAASSSS